MVGNGFYSGGAIIARGLYYGGGGPDDEKDEAAAPSTEREARSGDPFTEALASSSSSSSEGTPIITGIDAIDYMQILKGLGVAFLMLSGAAAGNAMFGSNRPWDSYSAQRAMSSILHDGATYSDWLFFNQTNYVVFPADYDKPCRSQREIKRIDLDRLYNIVGNNLYNNPDLQRQIRDIPGLYLQEDIDSLTGVANNNFKRVQFRRGKYDKYK